MIKIKIPNNNVKERTYILEVVFHEFLGINFILEIGSNRYEIILNNTKSLVIEDNFFNKHPGALEYLNKQNIPNSIKDLDIFAACFFMLTRWEEYVEKTRDSHDRFPATASLAYKDSFLSRPIVNEKIEWLKNVLMELDGSLKFKTHQSKTFVSCDVDQPFDCTVENFKNLIRVGLGDILKRKNINTFAKRIRRYVFNKFDNYKYDENYTFKWYMDICDKSNVKASFYFIPDSSENGNGCYGLKDKKIQKLLKYIDNRGHGIGVHGSYQTYKDKDKAKKQKDKLQVVLNHLNINQKVIGNRQHYLMWDSSITPQVLEHAGFEYDTTGGYADMVGFRYGVCYEFSMFDILNRKKLKTKQRPLIVMECSVIDKLYMGLGCSNEAVQVVKDLKQECFKYNGNFSLLWHNSYFKTKEYKNMFTEIIHA